MSPERLAEIEAELKALERIKRMIDARLTELAEIHRAFRRAA